MKIAFYCGKGLLLNYIIRFYQRLIGKKYWRISHCELLVNFDCLTNSYVAYGSSALDNGVRIKHIRIDPDHWKILEIGDSKRDFAIHWMWVNLGKSYDYNGMWNKLLPFIKPSTDKWDCNEAVQAMLGIEGDMTPADLAEMLFEPKVEVLL